MSTFDSYAHRYLNDPNADLWDNGIVNRFSQEGEQNFAVEFPCILTRLALAVTNGTAVYTLPDDVLSIRRITWRGYKLDPLPQRSLREVFQSAQQVGRPFWYVFNNVGLNQIQFFPIPPETIASVTTNLYGTEIPNRVIVEYFQAPDFNSAIIPDYFRRRLLKSYVLRSCFGVEGQGQNTKNSTYYKKKWMNLKEMYGELLYSLHNKPRKLVVSGITAAYYFPGPPILPISRFGIACDTGE